MTWMEKFNMTYQNKNIPVPSKRRYITQLLSGFEKVTKGFDGNV